MRKNSKKNNMLNEQLKRTLSVIVSNEVKDPKLEVMTSITEVIVAPDLKTAKVYVSVLGDKERKDNSLEALNRAGGFLRSRLAESLNLRITPKLIFIEDNSLEYGAYIDKLIDSTGLSKASDSEDYE